ncbi:MAG TPA: carboxymuconolactone decarboxylase family protein [Candidatus Limnocylindria bacterium]|nr:carboxymuconolactone decarboxylase family protein [Candidatus Limnocylindria bacterium]
MPALRPEEMTEAQRTVSEELIAGPRKGVKGPFISLLRSPALLERVAKLGGQLRFQSVLDGRVNEFVTMIVARHLTNQFEWAVHQPLALKAGLAPATAAAVAEGRRPDEMRDDEALAYDFTLELLHTHGVSETTYRHAVARLGEQGVVELTTLVGYFVMVSWVINVARTPAPADTAVLPLDPFPA